MGTLVEVHGHCGRVFGSEIWITDPNLCYYTRSTSKVLIALSIVCTSTLLLSIVSGGMFEPKNRYHYTPATEL